jgi:Domain of unknown function (DUF397)
MMWITSSYCSPVDPRNCVQVAFTNDVHVRDSKNPEGAQLRVTPKAWASFIRGLSGEQEVESGV